MPQRPAVRAFGCARWLILGLVVACAAGSAQAENDYYDNVSGGAAAKAALPRLALQNGQIELVAVAQGKQLVIYLDRFDDGRPINHAKIEVAVGEDRLQATQVKDGVYVAAADWAGTPGQYKLSFATSAEQASVTLAGTLIVAAPKADAGETAKEEDEDSGSASSTSSPLTVSVPLDVALSIGLGVLAALGLSALAVLRRAPATVAVAGPRSRLAAWPARWVAAMLALGCVISLLVAGGSVLARKAGTQQGGVVGLLH